jgi:hypothetical protein
MTSLYQSGWASLIGFALLSVGGCSPEPTSTEETVVTPKWAIYATSSRVCAVCKTTTRGPCEGNPIGEEHDSLKGACKTALELFDSDSADTEKCWTYANKKICKDHVKLP